MATSKSFFGLRRGRVGNLVFAAQGGKQITRVLAESVKNPKTVLQNVQRMLFAGVSAERASMNVIVNHAIESVTPKIDQLSEFTSANLKRTREYKELFAISQDLADVKTTYAPLASSDGMYTLPTNHLVSQGSLTSVAAVGDAAFKVNSAGRVEFLLSGLGGDDVEGGAANLTTVMNNYGIGLGDMITFVVERNAQGSLADGDNGLFTKFGKKTAWVRFKMTALPVSAQRFTIADFAQCFEVRQGGDVDANLEFAWIITRPQGSETSRVLGLQVLQPVNVPTEALQFAVIHSNAQGERSVAYMTPCYLGDETGALISENINRLRNSWVIGDAFVLNGGVAGYNEGYELPSYYGAPPVNKVPVAGSEIAETKPARES